ncbi:MAG: cobalt ECF transporter T component CbiQ [Candidatus Omnitrophota bacterium]
MNNIGKNYFDIGQMDTLASGNSFLHRLDPRAKLITTLVFILSVVSFDKYALSALTPFFIYPVILITFARLPRLYLFKKVLWASPFAILVGMFNPLIDQEILLQLGPIGVSGGWISFLSIFIRCLLTVTAALILVSLTGFNAVAQALLKLGVPKYFVVQLLFFYRYIFVLTDEAERMVRARAMRTFKSGVMGFKTFIPLIGHLLLRTLDRAERIYLAMCCRGFDGNVRMLKTMKIRRQEIIFTLAWIGVFALFRGINIPMKIGELLIGAWK